MAISFVGAVIGTTSATLPAHLPDDIIIGYAFRSNSNTPPTLPSGWTIIQQPTGTVGCSATLGFLRCTTSAEVSGTWTNASNVIFQIYRGCLFFAPVGNSQSNTGLLVTATLPGLTLQDAAGGGSWVASFIGASSTLVNLGLPPLGMTTRLSNVRLAGYDTNGPKSNFGALNIGLGISLTTWNAMSMELREGPTVDPVQSPEPSPTPDPTPSVTPSITPSISITPSLTNSITPTPTLTNTATITPTGTFTRTPTSTISNTPTLTTTPTNTATPSNTITPTLTQSITPTLTSSPTLTPTRTPTAGVSVTPTSSITPTPTLSATITPTLTQTITPSATPAPVFGIQPPFALILNKFFYQYSSFRPNI